MEYRKVIVRGKFDHSTELYLQPRTLIPGSDTSELGGGGGGSGGGFGRPPPKTGANVITAFQVSSDHHPKCVAFVLLGLLSVLLCAHPVGCNGKSCLSNYPTICPMLALG